MSISAMRPTDIDEPGVHVEVLDAQVYWTAHSGPRWALGWGRTSPGESAEAAEGAAGAGKMFLTDPVSSRGAHVLAN